MILSALAGLSACGPSASEQPDGGALPDPADAATSPGDPDAQSTDPTACPAGGDGLACLFDLWDRAGDCDAGVVTALVASVEARRGALPAWYEGRALFASFDRPVSFAGEFNDWVDGALVGERLCETSLYLAESAVPSGHYQYKIVDGGTWMLDPESWAYAYDDFSGNPDGRNSVLNTYDSGVGHLAQPTAQLCSSDLGNCRSLHTYLPPGYGAPANADRRYPALFMHDGQNIFDDHDCCFGHTGWELNVALDEEIAAGRVEPIVVVGFEHAGAQRTDEYGYATADGGMRETFMAFQIDEVQPTAAGYWRLDADRYYTAGSSLGGLISFALALEHPDVYRGAASLSGSFWLGQESGTSVGDIAAAAGLESLRLYMDHGGTDADGADNLPSNRALRDQLTGLGWVRGDAPSCTAADTLCYYHAVGATHDELAWRARGYLFLRYLFPAE